MSVMHWRCGQRGKGDQSRFSATALGMRLAGLDLDEQKERC